MTSGTTDLLESFEQGILTLTMNRPDRRNALSLDMAAAMHASLQRAAADPAVRAVVLTGAGQAFCAGGDVKNMASGGHPGTIEQRQHSLKHRAEASRLLHTMAKPTIAVIRGAAAGAGLALALACDFRLAADSAKLTSAFAKVGLSGDYGASFFLTQLVGPAKARELMMLSPVLGAREALALGLVHRVFSDEQMDREARDFAQALADGPSVALGYIKQNINQAVTGVLQASIDSEAEHQVRCMTTDDHREASQAFVDKRKPAFKGA